MNGMLMRDSLHKATRDGLKTVTRRLDHLKEINLEPDKWKLVAWDALAFLFESHNSEVVPDGNTLKIKPRYHAGEIAYIKEVHYAYGQWIKELRGWVFYRDEEMAVVFDSTDWKHALKGHGGLGWYKRSPLFLPAKFARTFVKIKDVRPERLQEITEEDAIKEGIVVLHGTHQHFGRNPDTGKMELLGQPEPYTALYHYAALWDEINDNVRPEARLYTLDDKSNKHFIKGQHNPNCWESNPWVIRYEYELTERPNE